MKTSKQLLTLFSGCILICCVFASLWANGHTNANLQSDPADDFVGTYTTEDTVIILDMKDSLVSTNYRNYSFSITKVDSTHVKVSNFDDCNNVITIPVSPSLLELNEIEGCIAKYCDVAGNLTGNTLSYHFVLCLGAPGLIKTSGVATK